jgi:outer membrane protein assembly factor BamB
MKFKAKQNLKIYTACVFIFVCVASLNAMDWPTYMNSNSRSGVTSEALELDDLNSGWVYTSPAPPQVAWDQGAPWDSYAGVTQVPMRNFDFVLSVTVVGDSVYFGSSVTDSVHCLEVLNGSQKWFYTTNGPVRYPPTYYEGRLYFGSDDGYVYCIDADNGTFIWKYSPSGATRLIGNNNSLIPMWPIRTGAAVADGKVYFAASLVNWQSSYLCAVDALTGSDSGGGLYKVSGGVTPLSAILLSDTKIYLQQGRMYPYAFDRSSGSSLGPIGTDGDGGCYALITEDNYFVHGLGQDHQSGYELRGDKIAVHPDGRALVVANDTTYLLTGTSLSAINRSNSSTIWSVPCDCPYALIYAGGTLFAGGTNKVAAYNSTDGQQLWTQPVNGRVRSLAAADGRLYASTDTGSIHMFGSAYLPADFDKSGTVDLPDLLRFLSDYFKCTNPNDPACENLLD